VGTVTLQAARQLEQLLDVLPGTHTLRTLALVTPKDGRLRLDQLQPDPLSLSSYGSARQRQYEFVAAAAAVQLINPKKQTVAPDGNTAGTWRSSCHFLWVSNGPYECRDYWGRIVPVLEALEQLHVMYVEAPGVEYMPLYCHLVRPLRMLCVRVYDRSPQGALDAAAALPDLEYLSIVPNNIFSSCNLPPAFTNLQRLTKLCLQGTGVRAAGLEALGPASGLLDLDLSRNQHVTALPDAISRLTALTALRLLQSGVTELPPAFTSITGLRIFSWSIWPPEKVPAVALQLAPVWHLTSLNDLIIEDSTRTSLSADISRLVELSSLHINARSLEELPDSITTLVGLQQLSMSCMFRLQGLPEGITALTQLTSMELDRKVLEGLPPAVQSFVAARKAAEEPCWL
jgi:hypothetical protein